LFSVFLPPKNCEAATFPFSNAENGARGKDFQDFVFL
jgi:hypothetical protein